VAKLREDIDKITGKNNRLFEDFMIKLREVETNYDKSFAEMGRIDQFFKDNKARYQECLEE